MSTRSSTSGWTTSPKARHRPRRRHRPPEAVERALQHRPAQHRRFLTVGIDSDAASDLFAILANREHRLPTMIASQTGPAHWVAELPDRVAADSIVNRLANNARIINLGQIDMRRHRNDQARAHETYWE
ncbi:ATP-binding protein [Cryobacterium sp. Sr3]|uniref:ATP-binding protein n=1 Tax=Cryobacterium sp. Sr3 TaxID=1259194 RepID=UPI0024118C12|nr:ATP-binding protein [Cryobacterium sp. Sr3]